MALVPAFVVSAADYTDRFGVARYVSSEYAKSVLLVVLAALVGVAVGRSRKATRDSQEIPIALLSSAGRLLTAAVVLTFGLWLAVSATRGLSIQSVLAALGGERGASSRNRESMVSVLALSMVLHQAPVAASLNAICIGIRPHAESAAAKRRLLALVVVGITWSFLNSERLALIAILISSIVAYLFTRLRHPDGRRLSPLARTRLTLFPLLIPVLLVAVFGLFELSRSWTARAGQESSITSYSTERVIGYYATSANNSALLIGDGLPLIRFPSAGSTGVQIFRNFPLTEILPQPDATEESFSTLLDGRLNSEFNNPGGFLVPGIAFGLLGGTVIWLFTGFAAARLFSRARTADLLGVLSYPILVIAIVEAPRIFLFGAVRGIAPIFGALLVYLHLSRKSARAVDRSEYSV